MSFVENDQSQLLSINPQERSQNNSSSQYIFKQKKMIEKTRTNDIFLTHKLKTQKSVISLQSISQRQTKAEKSNKVTLITKNVQPLDSLNEKSFLETIEEANQKEKQTNSKKRYYQQKLNQLSYNIKSTYFKKYKLNKSVRLKVQNQKSSFIFKQNNQIPLQPSIAESIHLFSASVNLQTIYKDKKNKIVPKNIEKYHNNFQLLKCALQKKQQEKLNRIFQRQRQIQQERQVIKEQIKQKIQKKSHSMRSRRIQQFENQIQKSIQKNYNEMSLPKINRISLISFTEDARKEQRINSNRYKLNGKSIKPIVFNQVNEKRLLKNSPYLNKNRFKTII